MSRLLYSVLKKIKSNESIALTEYKITSSEWNGFINLIKRKGFITEKGVFKKLEISPQGEAFLKEFQRFKYEMPSNIDELADWVRFEGDHYKRIETSIIEKSDYDYKMWDATLKEIMTQVHKSGDRGTLFIDEKASSVEMETVESALGMTIPASFKDVLINFSKKVIFNWSVEESRDSFQLEEQHNRSITAGGLFDLGLWDLELLPRLNQERLDCEHLDNEYRQHWNNSFAFSKNGAGEYFAIDLKYNVGEVICLSFDETTHGSRLGISFQSFFDNWIAIGCAGQFATEFKFFADDHSTFINKNSSNSVRLKEWLDSF